MNAEMTFEQLFYGSGQDGYGILASSPGAEIFRAAALSLCESFGTPSGADTIEPFLLCHRDGDRILLARVVQGSNDPQGRRTVFVHVLVTSQTALETAHVNPFVLARCGIFRETLPRGTPGAIDVDLSPLPEAKPAPSPTLPFPVVVQSSRPIPETLVRAAVGDRPWKRSWATWSWRFLDGFAVQALPPRTHVPDFVAVCDETGRLLRGSAVSRPSSVSMTTLESSRTESTPCPCVSPQAKPSRKLLAASLLINAVLGFACAWLFLEPMKRDTSLTDERRIVDKTAQELADILTSSYPDWQSGSLDAFLEPTQAKSWEQSPATGQSAVYQFLSKTYHLAVQSAQTIPPSTIGNKP